MNIFKKFGVYPKKLVEGAYNPRALEAAFAKFSNASLSKFRDPDGSIRLADNFGFGGYSVPLPDELKAKAGTIYPTGMQLTTQPLWFRQSYVSGTTTQLSFFNATAAGIAGNMDLAGALSFPKSFIIRAIRMVPQLLTAVSATTTLTIWVDLQNIGYTSFHTLRVLDKEYLRIPSFMLPSGAGIGTPAAAATFTAPLSITVGNWGTADPRSIFTLLDPLWLETQVSFTYTIDWAAAVTLVAGNSNIFVVFDGQVIRPVQ